MRTTARPFMILLLSLVLALASLTMAVARGQMRAGQGAGLTVVICSGYGITSIQVDAQGNPVGPVHPCPECLAGFLANLGPGAPQVPAPPQQGRRLSAPAAWQSTSRPAPSATARDPPILSV